jgi:hypothetical protein
MLSMLLLAGSTIVAGNCSAVWRVTKEGAKMPSRYELKFDLTCEGASDGPPAGYAAWFDAGAGVFTDDAGTTPAVADGDAVAHWASRGGSYGALKGTVPGGFAPCTLKTGANGINSKPIVRGTTALLQRLRDPANDITIFEGGILNVSEGTAFAVVSKAAGVGYAWADNAGYINHGIFGGPVAGASLWTGSSRQATKAFAYGAGKVLTWHHAAGTLYSGVNDTRTASMGSIAAGDMLTGAGYLNIVAGTPGNYLDGDLAELIFYPTALSEADRKATETYLALKYGITLPY